MSFYNIVQVNTSGMSYRFKSYFILKGLNFGLDLFPVCLFFTTSRSESLLVILKKRSAAVVMNFRVRPATKEDCKDISRMIMVSRCCTKLQLLSAFETLAKLNAISGVAVCWSFFFVFIHLFYRSVCALRCDYISDIPRSWRFMKKCPTRWRSLIKVMNLLMLSNKVKQ